MINIDEIKKYLEENTDKKRLKHIYGVVESAVELAKHYGVDEEKAYLAALLHDAAKQMDRGKIVELSKEYGFQLDDIYLAQPGLLHGVAGAYVAKNRFGVTDQDILDAIVYHTIPRMNMTKLDMVVSVADLVEKNRDYPNVDEIRDIAFDDLEVVFLEVLKRVMRHVLKKNWLLHPDSVAVYNNLLKELKKSDKL